ncbi:MAG: hypothetical protein Q4G35_00575 [Propionibacteriaceae bacterium]|nr:hypothetical protein [Propionibacteriaceae bacterium]
MVFWLVFRMETSPFMVYTPRWVAGIMVFFAVISLGCALLGPRWAGYWSLGGFLAGVVLGEVIGEFVYALQMDRLNELKQDPSYNQNWEPHQPGWLIAIVVFLALSAYGLWRGRSASGEPTPTHGGA